jgi:hypothetical protein
VLQIPIQNSAAEMFESLVLCLPPLGWCLHNNWLSDYKIVVHYTLKDFCTAHRSYFSVSKRALYTSCIGKTSQVYCADTKSSESQSPKLAAFNTVLVNSLQTASAEPSSVYYACIPSQAHHVTGVSFHSSYTPAIEFLGTSPWWIASGPMEYLEYPSHA